MSSTAMDYARFAQMLLNGGELDGVRLLSPKTVELMTSNNLPRNIRARSALGRRITQRAIDRLRARRVGAAGSAASRQLGLEGSTFGWAGAASTWAIMDPEEDMVLILMTQYMVADTEFAARFQTLAYQAIID